MVGLFNYPKRRLKKLVKEGEYRKAIEFGESIEEKFSQDSDYFFIMGSIYYILEDAKNAINYFDRSLKLNEFDTETLILKANVHLFLKEKKAVRDCCDQILKIDSEDKDAKALLENLDKI